MDHLSGFHASFMVLKFWKIVSPLQLWKIVSLLQFSFRSFKNVIGYYAMTSSLEDIDKFC